MRTRLKKFHSKYKKRLLLEAIIGLVIIFLLIGNAIIYRNIISAKNNVDETPRTHGSFSMFLVGKDGLFEEIAYEHVIVKVEAPAGAFPEGTKLRIIPITQEEQKHEIKEKLAKETEVTEDSELVSFDISFIGRDENGNEVELEPAEGKTVKISINYKKHNAFNGTDYDDNRELKMYHLEEKTDEQGYKTDEIEIEEVVINQDESHNGELVADANKFSIYTVADVEGGTKGGTRSSTYNIMTQMPDFEYEPIVICNASNYENCMTVMDRNLGATTAGSSQTTSNYGFHYQWGNNYGFAIGCTTSNCSDTVTNSSVSVNSNGAVWSDSYNNNGYYGNIFIKSSNSNSDYWSTTTLHNGLWGGTNDSSSNSWGYTLNNPTDRQGPCPDGWHVPSAGERSNLMSLFVSDYNNENSTNISLSTNSTYSNLQQIGSNSSVSASFMNYFKIPLAGSRTYGGAQIQEIGSYARYFTSTPGGSSTYQTPAFSVQSSQVSYFASRRAYGDSVRCFKDETLFYPLVSFYNKDNAVLSTGRVRPTKTIPSSYIPELSNMIGYIFLGRYESGSNTEFNFSAAIESDKDIVARYDCDDNYHWSGNNCVDTTYTVTWKNWNGTILETDTDVRYGTMPEYNGATPTKPSNGTDIYYFDTWSPKVSPVTGDIEYTATFYVEGNYLITFVNYDGTVLQSGILPSGTWPTYNGVVPTKPGDSQYTYTRSGWTPELSKVTKTTTYVAAYQTIGRASLIQFVNYDGTLLRGGMVPYGDIPVYGGDTPIKPSDGTYDYVFNGGWTPELSPVTGAMIYTAIYIQTSARGWQYDTWREGDNYETILITGTSNQCITIMDRNLGATSNNISNSNSYGTYFQWGNGYGFTTSASTNGNKVNVSSYGASEYYGSTYIRNNSNSYNSQWMNQMNSNLWGGGSDNSNNSYGQGQTNFIDRQGPCPAGYHIPSAYERSLVNTYWNSYKGYTANTTISSSNRNTFRSELKIPYNGYLGYSSNWFNGGLSVTNGGSYAYLYTSSPYDSNRGVTMRGYNGFQTNTDNYTARGEGIRCFKNSYSCPACLFNGQTIADGDSVTGYSTPTVPFGSSCDSIAQTRTCNLGSLNGNYQYSSCTVEPPANCTFQGQTIIHGTSLTVYSTSSTTCPNTCTAGTVTCYNGTVSGDTGYTNLSCSPESVSCTNATYPLVSCPPHGICNTQCTEYTANGNSCTTGTTKYALDSCDSGYHKEGNVCIYNTSFAQCSTGSTPANATPIITNVEITWNNGRSSPAACAWTCNEHYHTGANNNSCDIDRFDITRRNSNGSIITISSNVQYGAIPTYVGETPTSGGDAQYSYTFNGWTPEPSPVTGEATYTATYTQTVNEYEIAIMSNNINSGTVNKNSVTVPYGTTISTNSNILIIGNEEVTATPTPQTAQYTYEFVDWTNTCGNIVMTGCSITANFSNTLRAYTVTWKNYDGTTLETDTGVLYGTTPSYDGATPERPETSQYRYTFNGWTPSVSSVVGNATYTAKYTENIKYQITFDTNGGDSIAPMSGCSGDTITLPIATKTLYDFVGWYETGHENNIMTGGSLYTVRASTTLYAKWEASKSIIIQATASAANKTLKINKYFANEYMVDRGDGTTGNIVADTTHTYTVAGTYNIMLSLSGANRWTFQHIEKPLVPKTGTTMIGVQIIYMPSLEEGFGNNVTNPGNDFFVFFNYEGALMGLPAGSFDTSKITTVGDYFFSRFNLNGGLLTSLPAGSFDISNIEAVEDDFFSYFNYNGSLTSLPVGSFDISNIEIAGNDFFSYFNYKGSLTSLPTLSFDTSKITSVGYNFFKAFNKSGSITSLPAGSFNISNISGTVDHDFFNSFNNQGLLTSLPAGSFNISNITSVGADFFSYFNDEGSLTSLPIGSFDTSNITSVGNTFFFRFNQNGELETLPEYSFNTSNISGAVGYYFFDSFNFGGRITSLPIGSFDISNITSANSGFFYAFNAMGDITSLPVGSFDTSNITSSTDEFFAFFNYEGALESLPELSFNLSNVASTDESFFYAFNYEGKITYLPDSFSINSVGASVTGGYAYAFYSTNYTINKNVYDLVSGIAAPLDDMNTFSDNQPKRCGVHPNWLVNTTDACSITYDSNGGNTATTTNMYTADTTGVVAGSGIATPTKSHAQFVGWYTGIQTGNQITTVLFPSMDSGTLYAHRSCDTGYTLVNSECTDITTPSVVLSSDGNGSCTTGNTYIVTGVFSESVTGLDASTLTVTNGIVANFEQISGNLAVWTVSGTIVSTGTLSVIIETGSFTDLEGNVNTGESNTITRDYDLQGPEVEFTGVIVPECSIVRLVATGRDVGCAGMTQNTAYNFAVKAGWQGPTYELNVGNSVREILRDIRVRDNLGNTTLAIATITVTDTPPKSNDFSVDKVGLGTEVDWKIESKASDGLCGSEVLTAEILENGTQGECTITGDRLQYYPYDGASGSDTCTIMITDNEGSTGSFIVTWNGINKPIPQVLFVSPTPASGTMLTTNKFTAKAEISDVENITNLYYELYDLENDNTIVSRSIDPSSYYIFNFDNVTDLGEVGNSSVVSAGQYSEGTVYGATRVSSGRYGGAYSFDGVDDYIDLGILGMYKAYSIVLWAKPEGGEWTHFVYAYDPRGGGTYYVNGGYSPVMPLNLVGVYGNYSKIGGTIKKPATYFAGLIDEVSVYNRMISADEVQFLYKSNLRKTGIDTWEFEIENTCLDSSGSYEYYVGVDSDIGTYGEDYRTMTVQAAPTANDFSVNDVGYEEISVDWTEEAGFPDFSLCGNETLTAEVIEDGIQGMCEIDGEDNYILWYYPNDGASGSDTCTILVTNDYGLTGQFTVTWNDIYRPIPQITFVSPTPEDGAEWDRNRFTIKAEISDVEGIEELYYEINGDTYIIYQPVQAYNFDNMMWLGEVENNIVKDSVNLDGIGRVHGATWVNNGRYGGAYYFDGVDDFIDLVSGIGNGAKRFMVTYWVKPEGGDWMFVIAPSFGQIYLNGQPVSELDPEIGNALNLYVGYDGETGYFKGYIDEIVVYSPNVLGQLTDDLAQSLYKLRLKKIGSDVWEFQTLNPCLDMSGSYEYSVEVESDIGTSARTGRTLTTNIPITVDGTGYDFGTYVTTGTNLMITGTMGTLTVTDYVGKPGWRLYFTTSPYLVGEDTQETISTENIKFKANGLVYSGLYGLEQSPYVYFPRRNIVTTYTSAASGTTMEEAENNPILEYLVREEKDESDFMCEDVGTYSDEPNIMLEIPSWQVEDVYTGTLWITLQIDDYEEESSNEGGGGGDEGVGRDPGDGKDSEKK